MVDLLVNLGPIALIAAFVIGFHQVLFPRCACCTTRHTKVHINPHDSCRVCGCEFSNKAVWVQMALAFIFLFVVVRLLPILTPPAEQRDQQSTALIVAVISAGTLAYIGWRRRTKRIRITQLIETSQVHLCQHCHKATPARIVNCASCHRPH